jgi:hypothetical protein
VLWISVDGLKPSGARAGCLIEKGSRGFAFAQPETRVERQEDFFIWIRHNPLKSPNSAKGIQGIPSFFAWLYLVLLGFVWRLFALRLYLLA